VPGAELHVVPGMGHDMPKQVWPTLLDAIEKHTEWRRALAAA
jgi:hypothetical protein